MEALTIQEKEESQIVSQQDMTVEFQIKVNRETWLLNNKRIEKRTDVAACLMTRDYKGYGNQQLGNGVIECRKKSWERFTPKYRQIFRGEFIRLQDALKRKKHDLAVVYAVRGGADVEVKQIGNMDNNRENFENPQCGRVYDSEGLSPTLNTCQGGQREPKIIVAMRGRNPDNPLDRTAGSPTEQRLEPNCQGICNTLTSVQKDNMVLEKSIIQKPRGFNKGGEHEICPPITSHSFQENNFLNGKYRIRKLTPLECWRLMGFSDEDLHKAEKVNSNSQLYKQAGNSIVKNVLMAIFGQMIPGKENEYKND